MQPQIWFETQVTEARRLRWRGMMEIVKRGTDRNREKPDRPRQKATGRDYENGFIYIVIYLVNVLPR